MTTHFVLPDCQVKPGLDLSHLKWAGQYAAEKKPDVIICLGDFADMESLSSYDVGKKAFEGRTYLADIEAATEGMSAFMYPIMEEQARLRRNKQKVWNPRLVLTLGNHEARITTAINNDRKLDGLISIDDLCYEAYGWEVIPSHRADNSFLNAFAHPNLLSCTTITSSTLLNVSGTIGSLAISCRSQENPTPVPFIRIYSASLKALLVFTARYAQL